MAETLWLIIVSDEEKIVMALRPGRVESQSSSALLDPPGQTSFVAVVGVVAAAAAVANGAKQARR